MGIYDTILSQIKNYLKDDTVTSFEIKVLVESISRNSFSPKNLNQCDYTFTISPDDSVRLQSSRIESL